jgi:cold shock CspA family protein
VENRQSGMIAAEDGEEYVFTASALRDVSFSQLSLGTPVSFAAVSTDKPRRAENVRKA